MARAALIAAVAAAWAVLAPITFGGQTAYVIVAGASMEPALHQGDLVLARPAPSYEVGQVVAYHHPKVGPVIHRIIERRGAHYVLQGDSNTWVDSYAPGREEIVGRAWLVVRHAGMLLMTLRTPAGLAVLSLVLASLLVLAVGRSPGKSVASEGPASPSKKRRAPPPRPSDGTIFALAALGLGCLLLAAAAFTQPTTTTAPQEAPFQQTGRFTYGANAPATVYSGADLETGDPVFDALVPSFIVSFDYTFASVDPADLRGTLALTLEVSEPNGWKRTLPLQPATPFVGNRAHGEGRVDTATVRRMISLLESATSLDRDSYHVDVIAEVQVEGRLAGHEYRGSFQPSLPFALDDFELYLRQGDPAEGDDGDPTTSLDEGALTYPASEPATLSILGAEIPVTAARAVSVAGLLLAVGSAAFLLVPHLRYRRRGEAARVLSEYGALLVSVSDVPAADITVEVLSFADLLRLSERTGQTILHAASGPDHDFFLQAGGTTYHLRLSDPGPAAEPGEPV